MWRWIPLVLLEVGVFLHLHHQKRERERERTRAYSLPFTNQPLVDYFSREIAPLHSQSSRRLSNLSTSSHPHANYITTMSLPPTPGSFQSQSQSQFPGQEPQPSPFAAQPFSTDLCPPRVGLIQPGGNGGTSQGGTPMEEYTGVAGEVEKARNVHGSVYRVRSVCKE